MERSMDEIWEYLVEHELFTDDELHLVTRLHGYREETLNSCIYIRYGYHDLDQLIYEEGLENV